MSHFSRKRVALIVLTTVTISATLAVGAVALATRDTRQDIDLADFAHASAEVPALEGYAEATGNLCRGVPGCTQGFRATHVAYRKFASEHDAAAYASSSPGSYLSNWIVIEYTDGTLLTPDRQQIQQMIDSTAASE